jgi:hypothetical protein
MGSGLARYSDRLRTGQPGFDSRQDHEVLLCSTASRPALSPAQPPIQSVAEVLDFFSGVKRPGSEADHPRPSSDEVKNGRAIPPLPDTSSWRSA